jgi:hypothetical protein
MRRLVIGGVFRRCNTKSGLLLVSEQQRNGGLTACPKYHQFAVVISLNATALFLTSFVQLADNSM